MDESIVVDFIKAVYPHNAEALKLCMTMNNDEVCLKDATRRIRELEEERDIARNAGHALGYECGEDERIKLRKALEDCCDMSDRCNKQYRHLIKEGGGR